MDGWDLAGSTPAPSSNNMETFMVRLGARFSYNGREWSITGFSNNKVAFSDGNIKSSMDFSVFTNLMQQGWIRFVGKRA